VPTSFGTLSADAQAQVEREFAMSVRETITALFQAVAVEQKRELAPLGNDLKLLNSGLDSLSFALIVARLEDKFGFDPFETVAQFPVTFGDFVKLYEAHSG
jgi:acyl carrier protein